MHKLFFLTRLYFMCSPSMYTIFVSSGLANIFRALSHLSQKCGKCCALLCLGLLKWRKSTLSWMFVHILKQSSFVNIRPTLLWVTHILQNSVAWMLVYSVHGRRLSLMMSLHVTRVTEWPWTFLHIIASRRWPSNTYLQYSCSTQPEVITQSHCTCVLFWIQDCYC